MFDPLTHHPNGMDIDLWQDTHAVEKMDFGQNTVRHSLIL